VNGNKRAAFLCVGLFLALNGRWLKVGQAAAIVNRLSVADGSLEEASIADWIRSHAMLRD
jgi:death on curing protein